MKFKTLLFPLFFIFSIPLSGQTISHTYRFFDDLKVAQPQCGPDLAQAQALGSCNASTNPGEFVKDLLPCQVQRTVYHNTLNWGLVYPNADGTITTTYTIQMYVKVTDWGPTWSRIIDFSDGTLDDGIYFKNTGGSADRCMDFYPYGISGACPFFNNNTYYLLTFTRNGQTGIMDVYVDNTLFVRYNDAAGRYVGKSGVPIYIFRDDSDITCESAEANFAYLGFTNQYSSQTDVDKVYNDICFVANINPYADFSITPNPSCAFPSDIDIAYTGNIPAPGTGYTFEWDWDGGKVVSGSGMGPYKVSWDSGGEKTVTLTIRNNECGNVLINKKTNLISTLAVSSSLVPGNCETGTVGTLTVDGLEGKPPYQYSIDSVNYQVINTFQVIPNTYKVYVKDGNNCVASKEVLVEFNSSIRIQTIADTTICEGQTITLSTTSDADRYAWSPATGLDNASTLEPQASPTATTQYVVTATKGICNQRDTVTVTIAPPIQLNVTPDTQIYYGLPFQLMVSSPQIPSPATATYQWAPPDGLNNPSIATPVATLFADQTYTVDVTSQSGCTASGSVTLTVTRGEAINIPSAFSPNGDGKNEVLAPILRGIASIDYFRIYNRWGEVIFATTQMNEGWDGYYKGAMALSGSYVWEISGTSEEGKNIRKKGSVLLIR